MTPNEISPDPARHSTARTVICLLVGPIVWSAHLTIIYFSQSMLCAHGLASSSIADVEIVPMLVAAATAVCLAVLVTIMVVAYVAGRVAEGTARTNGDAESLRRMMIALAVLSALGIAWAGATVLAVPACPPLR